MNDGALTETDGAYQVLARKYRPQDFTALVGQEALVRTLTNAINTGRLAHAFVLTGVRGIGKTTTARIIARALNCIGDPNLDGPTPEPCGVCENCVAISEDRHVDVLEMDAASRTGVDDIREIIEGVRYRPTNARFKVYIIDEVHMLSRNAFNALLKTLEEPPAHVKFIFATTEIRKVPVTVLSRCQRFDLRRVSAEQLAEHFGKIIDKEGAKVAPAALHLICRAADGSVRDGLSLLDQAISMADGEVSEAQVRDMLGLADRSQSFELLDAVFQGDAATALKTLDQMYLDGADPAAVLEDMAEIVHLLTKIRVVPETADSPDIPEIERTRGKDMAGRLGMAALSRAWQMLLKGLGEVRTAPNAIQAAEMVIVRLSHAANLPTPEEALKKLSDGTAQPAAPSTPPPAPAPSLAPQAMAVNGGPPPPPAPEPLHTPSPQPETASLAEPALSSARPHDFQDLVQLAGEMKEGILQGELISSVHLVTFEPGRMEFRPAPGAPDDLAGRLAKFLEGVTERRWMVSVSNAEGQPTIAQVREQERDQERAEAEADPLVQEVLKTFPGSKVSAVRPAKSDADDDS